MRIWEIAIHTNDFLIITINVLQSEYVTYYTINAKKKS